MRRFFSANGAIGPALLLGALLLLADPGLLGENLPTTGQAIEPKSVLKPSGERYRPARSFETKRFPAPQLELRELSLETHPAAARRAPQVRDARLPLPHALDPKAESIDVEAREFDVLKARERSRESAAFQKAYQEALRIELTKRALQKSTDAASEPLDGSEEAAASKGPGSPDDSGQAPRNPE